MGLVNVVVPIVLGIQAVDGHLLPASISQCQDGWTSFESSCYIVINKAFDWFDAKTTCSILHGRLVEIRSQGENNFVRHLLQTHSVSKAWIGLQDFAMEGHFVWTSTLQQPAYFTNWSSRQPDNAKGRQHCGVMLSSGMWSDEECRARLAFICRDALLQ